MDKEKFEKPEKKLKKEREWADNETRKTEDLFKIRPTNEEGNDYIITVGNHLATENHFETKEEAEDFIRFPKWETIMALVSEIMQIHEKNKHKEKNL